MVIYKYGIQVTENVNSHALHLLRKRNNHDIISHGFWKKKHIKSIIHHSIKNCWTFHLVKFKKILSLGIMALVCLFVCLLFFVLCFLRGCLLVCFFFWGGGWSSSHTDSNCFDQNIDFGFFKGRFNSNHLHLNLFGIICLLRCGTDA